jgi:murein DD-endopeptidase MepM/ murein hydrolase activator NlpD
MWFEYGGFAARSRISTHNGWPVLRRSPLALALVAIALALGSPGSSAPERNLATSQAFAIKIVIPGQSGAMTGYVAAPKDSVGFGAGFSYPDDGSVLTSGAVTSSASANPSQTSTASASAEVTSLSLFKGEVTVDKVDAKVGASAGTAGPSSGNFDGTAVSGVGGTAVSGTALGNWGTLAVSNGVGGSADTDARRVWHGSVTALSITLTADHGGLPAGSQILVGYAEANVDAAAAPPPTTTPVPTPAGGAAGTTTATTDKAPSKPPEPGVLPRKPIDKIPDVHPKLTAGGYVFPVYGPVGYGDTFGASRADVGWHHGDDIFAPLGAPVLAVATGTVFSVGWNDIGGWRLWLRDRQGNQFYYAHLSAYSLNAVNGAHVRAGAVLGFVGNTGDAQGTPYHLHFEIHPVSLLAFGYDGVVDPTPYLDAWRRVQDIRFAAAAGWLPATQRGVIAPEPGAILLQVSDISSASGLDPASLQRAMAPIAREGDSALVGGLVPPTSAGAPSLSRG